MIPAVVLLLKIGFWISLISLLAGLVKPVYVLWFLDRMNRLKILKLYGSLCLMIWILIRIIGWIGI